MSINSDDMFAKVFIENGYSYRKLLDDFRYWTNEVFHCNQNELGSKGPPYKSMEGNSVNYDRPDIYSMYFFLSFYLCVDEARKRFDKITEGIKNNCSYVKTYERYEIKYILYDCNDASVGGFFSLRIIDDVGSIASLTEKGLEEIVNEKWEYYSSSYLSPLTHLARLTRI